MGPPPVKELLSCWGYKEQRAQNMENYSIFRIGDCMEGEKSKMSRGQIYCDAGPEMQMFKAVGTLV